MIRFQIRGMIFLLLFLNTAPGTSWAWYDKTHLAIAKAAGYQNWYNAAAADLTKVKAGAVEDKNHFFNNDRDADVTTKTVMGQVDRYNHPQDEEGHLYGAIVAALREYQTARSAGQYAEYHMAFAVHYIGDLSQPLHNISHDRYNKSHHAVNDGIVENEVMDRIGEVQKKMYEISLRPDHFDEDIAKEIARIANVSHRLGLKLRAENRDMTKEEAYVQLGHSASLVKAVLKGLEK
ncbi:MAG TPA: hypothetical protein VFH55_07685 [Nitrospiria bacterium]|nr:hypothetical protein [Nitrospiria bacterium]